MPACNSIAFFSTSMSMHVAAALEEMLRKEKLEINQQQRQPARCNIENATAFYFRVVRNSIRKSP